MSLLTAYSATWTSAPDLGRMQADMVGTAGRWLTWRVLMDHSDGYFTPKPWRPAPMLAHLS